MSTSGEKDAEKNGAERKLVISAAGCGELLLGTGYRHGQLLDAGLDEALKVVRELHEHGLDVMLARMKVPLLVLGEKGLSDATEYHGVRCIYVVPVNWFELAGALAEEDEGHRAAPQSRPWGLLDVEERG